MHDIMNQIDHVVDNKINYLLVIVDHYVKDVKKAKMIGFQNEEELLNYDFYPEIWDIPDEHLDEVVTFH